MPPTPIWALISYGPRRVPGARATGGNSMRGWQCHALEARRVPAAVPRTRSAARVARAIADDRATRPRSPHLAVSFHPSVRGSVRRHAASVPHRVAYRAREDV